MRIGLIPLDERPANTRDPVMTGAVAGVTVVLPPADLLSHRREPAQTAAVAAWLRDEAPSLDALVVSCDMVAHGGLIASRTTHDPVEAVVGRLAVVREIRRARPDLAILGCTVVTRIADADDSTEEPAYWGDHGRSLARLSRAMDRHSRGEDAGREVAAIERIVPAADRGDWLRRRARNHALNLAVLGLAAEGVFDLLVVGSDDTSPDGLASREKAWAETWAGWLDLGGRVIFYPGADEIGCVLVARAILQASGVRPRFAPDYLVPGGERVVAPFEDGPVSVTVERQVAALGGEVTGADDASADVIHLAINPPVPAQGPWDPDNGPTGGTEREADLRAGVGRVARSIASGKPVAIADVAYPNGAAPRFTDLLLSAVAPADLAAYGAWNTAGNTIGGVVAQAALAGLPDADAMARQRLTLHRFVEDWGYQGRLRAELRAWLRQTTGAPELPPGGDVAAAASWLEPRLAELMTDLAGGSAGWCLVPGSVGFPWGRTFEVDFRLGPMAGPA